MDQRLLNAIFVARYDSEIKWAAAAARRMGSAANCKLCLIGVRESTLSAMAPFGSVVEVPSLTGAVELVKYGVDFVFAAMGGGDLERFSRGVHLLGLDPDRRPMLVAAYTGIIIDGLIGGLSCRGLYDFVVANGPYDRDQFIGANLGFDARNILPLGLPFLSGRAPTDPGVYAPIVFADQPTIPSTLHERLYIVANLIALAEREPRRNVIIRPRYRPGQASFHPDKYRIDDLLSTYFGATVPENLIVDHTPLDELLSRALLLITVSSTAAIEAVSLGVAVAIITDFGIKESYGTSYFNGSGMFTTFSELANGAVPRVSEGWVDQRFYRNVDWAASLEGLGAVGTRSRHDHVAYYAAREKFDRFRDALELFSGPAGPRLAARWIVQLRDQGVDRDEMLIALVVDSVLVRDAEAALAASYTLIRAGGGIDPEIWWDVAELALAERQCGPWLDLDSCYGELYCAGRGSYTRARAHILRGEFHSAVDAAVQAYRHSHSSRDLDCLLHALALDGASRVLNLPLRYCDDKMWFPKGDYGGETSLSKRAQAAVVLMDWHEVLRLAGRALAVNAESLPWLRRALSALVALNQPLYAIDLALGAGAIGNRVISEMPLLARALQSSTRRADALGSVDKFIHP